MALYFKEEGNRKGKIIIFIHGGGISGWMWDKQLEHFKDYYCIVPDLPEHGRSINEGEISIKRSAHLIAGFIDEKVNGEKVNIVGHSLGAKITMELLSIRPEIIDHAVIASGLCRSIPIMKFSHRLFIYKLTIAMLKVNWILNYQTKQFKFTDKTSIENLKKDFRDMTSQSLFRIYDEVYENLTIPKGLKDIDVPTLVIAGQREPKAMKESVADITNILPNSKGVLIKHGLHTYPWVMHDYFNEIVRNWIENRSIDNEHVFPLK